MAAAGAGALSLSPAPDRGGVGEGDTRAVEAYLAQLSETVPRPAEAAIRSGAPEDPKLAKRAAKLDRAEPIVRTVFSVAR
ncbi:MAG: hypothetical protein QOI38_1814 [Sphingomonadales bacterium]|jgi:hypothetical protein|nr:hypothetical protein [Sphingomonadales bacterium]